MAATCRTCKAPVVWVEMASTGKRNPLDAEPRDDGNVMIRADGKAVVVPQWSGMPDWPTERYVSHFSTCPDANSFRRA